MERSASIQSVKDAREYQNRASSVDQYSTYNVYDRSSLAEIALSRGRRNPITSEFSGYGMGALTSHCCPS